MWLKELYKMREVCECFWNQNPNHVHLWRSWIRHICPLLRRQWAETSYRDKESRAPATKCGVNFSRLLIFGQKWGVFASRRSGWTIGIVTSVWLGIRRGSLTGARGCYPFAYVNMLFWCFKFDSPYVLRRGKTNWRREGWWGIVTNYTEPIFLSKSRASFA